MNSNYYSNTYNSGKNPKKLGKFLKVLFFIILVLIILLAVFSHTVVTGENSVLGSLSRLPVIKQFRQVFGMENLKGELNNRINFLILGQGGVGHEGPYLTDTIIFASLKPSTKELAMFSIPRDLYVKIPDNGWSRINVANSIGETTNYAGGGAAFTAKVIEELFDQPVHYWLRIDFDGFEKIINDLDGINVCVEHAFVDEEYPDKNFGVQTIEFETGCQNMDGQTALQFSRSRHGTNGEGSDFARSARQQKIILAVKNKAMSLGTLTNPQKVYTLIKNLNQHIQTNIGWAEIPHLIGLFQNIKENEIKKIVLDNSPQGLLRNGMTDEGAFILQPRTGDLSEIQNLAKFIFLLNGQVMEPVKIIILNATQIRGWANDIAGYLEQLNFKILSTTNVPQEKTFEKTVIYDLEKKPARSSDGENKDALMILRKSLGANVSKYIPEFLNANEVDYFSNADYLVVLGCKENGECWVEDEIYKELDNQPASSADGQSTDNNQH